MAKFSVTVNVSVGQRTTTNVCAYSLSNERVFLPNGKEITPEMAASWIEEFLTKKLNEVKNERS